MRPSDSKTVSNRGLRPVTQGGGLKKPKAPAYTNSNISEAETGVV